VKVLLVSQPASDGVFRHVEALANYLIDQGVRVHLAYSDRAACDQLQTLVARVASAGGDTLNLRIANQPGPADLPALLALQRFVRQHSPDIVHAHSSKAGALVRGLALLGMKPRVFYTPHAYYRMNAPGGAKARFFHAIERVLKRTGITITCSSDEAAFARDYIGVSPGAQRTIANGVDCTRFRPGTPEDVLALRRQFGVPQNALLLGTVGRFSAQKDPVTTYAALARVMLELPNLFFVHLGKGELEPEVDALLAQNGLGHRCLRIPYLADTAPFYRVLDGFVLGSLYEGMSYALLEALASGLPLILTRAPGNQDFGNLGLDRVFWAAPQDPASLAEAVLAWGGRTDARASSCNHRAVAVKSFSLEIGYARLLAEYRSALLSSGVTNDFEASKPVTALHHQH
jgi:glycosyltransferase involved in cell wall biosynthesis